MNKVTKIFSCIAFVFAFCFLAIGYAAVQDTLLVSGSVSIEAQNKVFAVYGPTYDSNGRFMENALNFYNRPIVQEGDEIRLGEGKQDVVAVYTGFDTTPFTNPTEVSWSSNKAGVYSVAVVDEGIKPTNTAFWFTSCVACTSFDLENLDTSAVTSMQAMFSSCDALSYLDISSFDTTNVTNTMMMFAGCASLEQIIVDVGFHTENIEQNKGGAMFSNCNNLVGGAGSTKDAGTGKDVARIDGGMAAPGLFTYKYYAIIFDGNHERTENVPPMMLSEGNTITLPEPPTHPWATFLGWATTADATVPEYTNTLTIEDLTPCCKVLYAVWEGLGVVSKEDMKDAIMNTETGSPVIIGGGEWNYGPYDNINEVEYKVGIMTAYVHAERITINDGLFKNGLRIDDAIVTINGGTFEIDVFWAESSDIIINGGEWTADDITFYADSMPTVTIFGGTFKWNPTSYVAAGHTVTYNESNGIYTVSCNNPVNGECVCAETCTCTTACSAEHIDTNCLVCQINHIMCKPEAQPEP